MPTKKLVLGRRICLRALALALRLWPEGLVGELVLKQRLHFDVALVFFLLPVVIRKLVVKWEAVQVHADLITHEGRLIIASARRERPAAVLALCLVGVICSGRRTALEAEVLHVGLVGGGRHFVEQVAGVR